MGAGSSDVASAVVMIESEAGVSPAELAAAAMIQPPAPHTHLLERKAIKELQ